MKTGFAALIGLLGVAQYWNSLSNDLVFDDHLAIRGNDDVDHTKTAWVSLLTHDFWGKDLRQIDSHKSYRPFTTATFRLNHIFAGGFDASQMHLTNAVLHGITCFVFVFLSLALFDDTRAAVIGGLIFATHPVHVEAITGVVGRSEPLCATFSMLCFLSYRRAALASGSLTMLLFIATAASMFVLATLSKEIGITVVGVLAVYDLFMLPASSTASTSRHVPVWHCNSSVSSRCWLFFRFSLLLGVMACYLCTRLLLMSEIAPSASSSSFDSALSILNSGSWANATLNRSELIRKTENPFIFTEGLSRVLSLMYLHSRYLQLLLFPVEMCAEYSFDCIPAVRTITDPRNASSAAAYLGMLALGLGSIYRAVYLFAPSPPGGGKAEKEGGGRKGKEGGGRKGGSSSDFESSEFRSAGDLVSVAWMLLPFLPASGVFVTVGTLLAERLLYIPSVGFCLLVGRALALLLKGEKTIDLVANETGVPPPVMDEEEERPKSQQQGGAVKGGGSSSRGATTTASTTTTTSTTTASSTAGTSTSTITTVASATTDLVVWGFVGAIISVAFCRTCLRTADWATDETLFASALLVCPSSAKMHQQYGQIQLNRHNVTGAFSHFHRAQAIDPEMCDIDFNLGMAYAGRNDYGAAARYFTKSLPCKFTNTKAFESLQKIWQAHQEMNPANMTLHAEMGETLAVIEQNDTAVVHLREAGVLALKLAAAAAAGNDAAGASLSASHRHQEAAHWFMRALAVIPTRCDIRYWQGKNFIQQGRLMKAAKALEKGTLPHCELNEVVSSGGELVQVYMQLISKKSEAKGKNGGVVGGVKAALRTVELQRGLGRAISTIVHAYVQNGGGLQPELLEYRKVGGQYWHQAGVSLANLEPPRHEEAAQCFEEGLALAETAGTATEQTEQQCLHRLWLAQSIISIGAPGRLAEVLAQLRAASECAGTAAAAKQQLAVLEAHGGQALM
jgi:tetratricopeptide (TPR) repeat protein